MKVKTLGAIGGLVAALGLVGCSGIENHNYVNQDAGKFLLSSGWKYVSEEEYPFDSEEEVDKVSRTCSMQFRGFTTLAKRIYGINPEGKLDTEDVCCILEYNTDHSLFKIETTTHAGYCDFLKQ